MRDGMHLRKLDMQKQHIRKIIGAFIHLQTMCVRRRTRCAGTRPAGGWAGGIGAKHRLRHASATVRSAPRWRDRAKGSVRHEVENW